MSFIFIPWSLEENKGLVFDPYLWNSEAVGYGGISLAVKGREMASQEPASYTLCEDLAHVPVSHRSGWVTREGAGQ